MALYNSILTSGGDIATALSTGTRVYLHSGSYSLSDVLNLTSDGIVIDGAGRGLVTITSTATDAHAISITGDGCLLRGFDLVSNSVVSGSILCDASSGRLEKLKITTTGHGIDFNSAADESLWRLNNIISLPSSGNGVMFQGAGGKESVMISACFLKPSSNISYYALRVQADNAAGDVTGPMMVGSSILKSNGTVFSAFTMNSVGSTTAEVGSIVYTGLVLRNTFATSGNVGLWGTECVGCVAGDVVSTVKSGATSLITFVDLSGNGLGTVDHGTEV